MSVFRTSPFTRAPLLLRRHPAVLAAVFGTAAILGLAAALPRLFVSSASSAALHQEIATRCAGEVGGIMHNFAPLPVAGDAVQEAWETTRLLDPPILEVSATPLRVAPVADPERSLPVRFVHRTGYRSHVEEVAQVGDDGVWMSDRAADYLGLAAGDSIGLVLPGGREETLLVAAVYRDLNEQPRSDYWCHSAGLFEPGPPFGDLPPPLVLVDLPLYQELFPSDAAVPATWEFPVPPEVLTLDQAESAVAEMDELGPLLQQEFAPRFAAPVVVVSELSFIVRRVRALGEVLSSSIRPVAAAVILSALGLIGAAGSYWVDRRRQELALLSAKGVAPAALAVKAALEMALPTMAGVAAGWVLALPVVALLGPATETESAARWWALWAALAAGVAALVAAGAVAGVKSARLTGQGVPRFRSSRLRLPAAVIMGLGAVWARAGLGDQGISIAEGDQVATVSPLVIVFPLLLFGAAVLLVAELVDRLRPLIRRLGDRSGPPLFLASRRIASAPVLVLVMAATVALPVATLVYATALSRSTTSNVDGKARTFIGSDVDVAMLDAGPGPASLAGRSTAITRIERAEAGEQAVDVLGVEPATFPRGGFWDSTFADQPLDELLAPLEGDGAALPAVIVNGNLETTSITHGGWDDLTVEVEVVGTARAFPGMRSDRPLVVVHRTRLLQQVAAAGESQPGLRHDLWVEGRSKQEVLAEFAAEGMAYRWANEARTVLDQLRFATVLWVFDFIELIGVLAGLIAIGVVLLYADTRQRARNLAYALARRMGLSRRHHLLAGFAEIGFLLVVGLALGTATAVSGARLLYTILDPLPRTPPGPSYEGATMTIAAAGLVTLLVAWVAAQIGQRAADRSDTSELLRHGN